MSRMLLVGLAITHALGCTVGEGTVEVEGDIDVEVVDEEVDDTKEPEVDILAATSNLLRNPSFELATEANKASYWGVGFGGDAGNVSTVKRTTYAAYAGTVGLRIQSDSGIGPWVHAEQLVPAIAGRRYTVSAITRRRSGEQGDQQMLEIRFYAGYTLIARARMSTGYSTTWHKVAATILAPSGTTQIAVAVGDPPWANLYGSVHDWDSVSLVAE